jgi:drug/metabolite transporter (DMT)-like permease
LTDVLLFTMAVIWGANFVVVKYATHIFNPLAFTGLRVTVAALFLLAAAFVGGGITLPRRDVISLLLLSSSSCSAWREPAPETPH